MLRNTQPRQPHESRQASLNGKTIFWVGYRPSVGQYYERKYREAGATIVTPTGDITGPGMVENISTQLTTQSSPPDAVVIFHPGMTMSPDDFEKTIQLCKL